MANRPTVPGWNTINLNKPNEYSSEFTYGGARFANVTDVSTGQRWLYSVSSVTGDRTLISSTTANGQVTAGPAYPLVSNQYAALNSANKAQSEFIIEKTSTAQEKQGIAKGSEYKSKLGNSNGTVGAGSSVDLIGFSSSYSPDLSNPIIPKGSILRYPRDLNFNQDRIVFTAVEIDPRSENFVAGQGANLGGIGSNVNKDNIEGSLSAFNIPGPTYQKVAGSVHIAIQSPIQDQLATEWTTDSITAIDALVYNMSASLIETANGDAGSQQEGTQGFQTALNQAVGGAKSNVGRLQRMFAGQAAGLNNILARTDGVVQNPNLELVFQGPQLRPFSFTFKLSARNEAEGNDIKTIIKYFKRHMMPRKEKESIFLRAPQVFTIMYTKGETSDPHPSINKISPTQEKRACALTNMSVDYTPLGSYMTFNDKNATMVAYTISLQFQEIEPLYSGDYDDSHAIGY